MQPFMQVEEPLLYKQRRLVLEQPTDSYAKATDVDVAVPDTFDWERFTDRGEISDWAEDAMRWAVYNQIITGTSTTEELSPQGNATCAQSAAILMRYMQGFGE